MVEYPVPPHDLQFEVSPRWVTNTYSLRSYIQKSLFILKHHKNKTNFDKWVWKSVGAHQQQIQSGPVRTQQRYTGPLLHRRSRATQGQLQRGGTDKNCSCTPPAAGHKEKAECFAPFYWCANRETNAFRIIMYQIFRKVQMSLGISIYFGGRLQYLTC